MARRKPHAHRGMDRAAYLARAAYNVVRPFAMPPVAFLGVKAAYDFLQVYPWHHLMFYWVGALASAGWAGLELFRDVQGRWRFRRWMRADAAEAASLLEPKVDVRRLPPWYARRYLRRKRELRT